MIIGMLAGGIVSMVIVGMVAGDIVSMVIVGMVVSVLVCVLRFPWTRLDEARCTGH